MSGVDIWETARTLWENSQISYAELVDKLTELFGDDAPKSKGTISKRAKKECWKKRKVIAEKKRNVVVKNHGNDGNDGNGADKDGNATLQDENGLTVWQTTQEKINQEAEKLALNAKQKSEIIFKHRKRVRDLGRLQDDTVAALGNLYNLDSDLDGEKIARMITIAETLSRTTKQLSDIQKVLFEQEMMVSGITLDDFKQSEQERRLESLQILAGIDEEERLARHRKLPMLQKRLVEFERLALGDGFDGDDFDDDG